ncbi:DDE-type integrase/transposase/recombinase [Hymenobacter sp.]|uniref:DDE-type integrase/transposase/recombinase n=1 Tax=Hymenobacter sp. TaxID=1898978 RepID=UPI0038D3D6ED
MGREPGRPLSVAATVGTATRPVAYSRAGGLHAPCPPLRHPAVAAELHAEGHPVGRYALRNWLHRHGLRALSTRPHRPRTTVADPAAVVAENRLLGQSAPTAPNRVWVGDITYLPLVGGRWCYLATWRDACSRRVVGGHLAAQMPTELVLHALEQALTLRQPAPGLICSRRPRQPVHQRDLPRPHRPSRGPAQLQPAGQPLRQRAG